MPKPRKPFGCLGPKCTLAGLLNYLSSSTVQSCLIFLGGDLHVNNKLLTGVPKTLKNNGKSDISIK